MPLGFDRPRADPVGFQVVTASARQPQQVFEEHFAKALLIFPVGLGMKFIVAQEVIGSRNQAAPLPASLQR